MDYKRFLYSDLAADVQVTVFSPEGDGVKEAHAIINLEPTQDSFPIQLQHIYEAESRLAHESGLTDMTLVQKRYFLSDAMNQVGLMRQNDLCACSVIQQPPLNGTKIGVWMYFIQNVQVHKTNDTIVVEHNGYKHLWNVGMTHPEGGSYGQTRSLLENYEMLLDGLGANIADNCVRTWFYVRDVDFQYTPMVVARRENFEDQGLTKDTHFIASTGICGTPASQKAIIQLGAYALMGQDKEQLKHIKGSSHLNPTHEYGVTFERGTAIHYGDREHVIISGTASINNKGEVMYPGDIEKQTLRMWENVETLLNEASCTFDDVMQIIVYLRDISDCQIVKSLFDRKFPQIPWIITLAPVCRRQWLIEMECVAVKCENNPQFKNF